MNTWLIKNALIIDPAIGSEEIRDLYIHNGLITSPPQHPPSNLKIIDAKGLTILPGFVDLHVHFREPGNENAETIKSGSHAAASGGFTTVVTMPNTKPAIDSAENLKEQLQKSMHEGQPVRIQPSACISRARKGQELTNLEELRQAGAIAFTDDGTTVTDYTLLRDAMRISAKLNCPIFDHALDPIVASNGVMRDGAQSEKMGLPGIPAIAETSIVERDIKLSALTGCHVHIQHISTKESVALIRTARNKGLKISAEATPHHLALTDSDVTINNTNFKMNPPLGTAEDVEAIKVGIIDGTIQAFATDHAPHTQQSKQEGFLDAPFGVVGLETAIGITYTIFVKTGLMSISEWAQRWTIGPAKIIAQPSPSLAPGCDADICILDLDNEWTVNPKTFLSKSQNTPFTGWKITGQAVYTFLKGILTWNKIDK